ncbi:universal stress protein [Chloroflexota bacterium]
MSERILVPLDGSKLGETALHYIEKMVDNMAPGQPVEIILLKVIQTLTREGRDMAVGSIIPYTEAEMAPIKKQAMDYLEKSGATLREKGAVVKYVVMPVERDVSAADGIIKAEDEVNADLVTMSTHGRHGITRWAFGSVTDKVLRAGKAPVLMVRAKGK